MPISRCPVCGNPAPSTPCLRCGSAVDRDDLLVPARRGTIGEFFAGVGIALRGTRLVLTSPGLLALAVVPLVLNAVVFVALVWLVLANRDLLEPAFEGPWWPGFDWLRSVAAVAIQWFGVLFGLALAALSTWVVYPIVAAPFLELLSEGVESLVVGQKDRRKLSLSYVVRFWILPILQAAVLALFTAVLGFVFVVSSFSAVLAPFAFVGTLWLLAVTLCDMVIARKSFPAGERFTFVRAGLPTWLGLALPFVFVPFLLAFAVAGATLVELRQRAHPDR
ncbi:MAG: EI24 domain-containing protein [Planctomycetes bacterium]|nr:EI24 domain-containing protein [Planctomycetota bacterium]